MVQWYIAWTLVAATATAAVAAAVLAEKLLIVLSIHCKNSPHWKFEFGIASHGKSNENHPIHKHFGTTIHENTK